MPKMPKGWKKKKLTGIEIYKRGDYEIRFYKKRREKKYVVEVFRQFGTYKRRLFVQEFFNPENGRKVIWQMMRQKEIRGYYSNSTL